MAQQNSGPRAVDTRQDDIVRFFLRAVAQLLVLTLVVSPIEAPAQDNTVEQLKELQELRKEVDRKKAELRRELRLLKDVLGDAPRDELMELAGGSGSLTAEELGAELRILREEIERLRQAMARERLTAEDPRFDVQGSTRSRLEWSDIDFTGGDGNVLQLLRTKVRLVGNPRHDTRVVVEIQDSRVWGSEFNTFDASGDGHMIEAFPTARPAEQLADDALVHTNHALWDEALARQATKQEDLMANSARRRDRALQLLDRDGIGVEDLMAVTRDDEAICQVSVEPTHIESSGAAIMRPSTLDFWAVWGLPSQNEYVHVPFAS